jgi:hypothetical protein
MSLSTGDVIDGKYRIIRLIGEGGMGAVYEGGNIRIHRTVAIKVLHAGVAENQDAVQRFEREAQAAGRIGSEHIVEVLDLGNLPDGDRFMVMEFMDGDSLSARIQNRGRLTARETYPVARQILEGLAAAHGAGIIHRDLKPDNVYLLKMRGGQADFVKLLDFGISKFSALSGESGFSMTRTGAVMGTPYYMSPEQAKGAKGMDHRADLYAVGVILYECVTGRVPFNADTFNELLFKIVLETPQPIEQVIPDSDPEFNKIIQKAMAREPGLRYQTAREFQQAVDQWASGMGVAAGRPLGALAATPAPGPRTAALPTAGVPTPSGGTGSRAGSDAGRRTGTPNNFASTGGAPFIEGGAGENKSNFGLIGALAAGVIVLGAGGFIAMHKSGGDAPMASGAPAAQSAGPSLEEVRAAAAEEAQKIASMAQKEADAKIKKAEEDARAAEARAKTAEANSKDKDEANQARERVKILRAAVAGTAKPASGKPPEGAPPSSPPASTGQAPTGRHIRTEL